MSNEYKDWEREALPHWYVYQKKFNIPKDSTEFNVVIRDVFDNLKFLEFTLELKEKQDKMTYTEFSEELQREAMYRFWSKFEYETEICGYGESRGRSLKIDVYNQLKLNWDAFVNYVWNFERD